MSPEAQEQPLTDSLATQPTGNLEILTNLFTYHAPSEGDAKAYNVLRKKGLELALTIDRLCPPSADRTVAIRQLREALMTANASIATGGGHYR